MRYIDFDGVMLDTTDLLFEEWYKLPNVEELTEKDKIEYVRTANWEYIIHNSPVINDSLYILKHTNPEKSAILTTVYSLENEGCAKVKYMRNDGIKQRIILVPWMLRKSDIVNPFGHILVDDNIRNLDDWFQGGGYPMFFDLKGTNTDGWGLPNEKGYQRVRRIDEKIRRQKNM